MMQKRSYEKELLDQNNISIEDIKANLIELNFINKWLGGHSITTCGIETLIKKKKQISICEIGCGGGDNLLAIDKWCYKKNIQAAFIGVDIKPECIAYASQSKTFHNPVEWMTTDYKNATFSQKPDIIFSALFTHHFTDEALVMQLQWMNNNCTLGFFINDLHRHPVAYYSIKILTKIFSTSYLVRNDAPLSVKRGFLKKEWEILLKNAGIKSFKIINKWAFRHLVICEKIK